MSTLRNEVTPLELYGHNLTTLAQQGAFAPLAGQDAVANRVFQVLSRKNKCCPMILDANESRRSAIILEVIRQMATGEAGEHFSQQHVIALDFEALFHNVSEDTPIRQQQRVQVLQQWKRWQQTGAKVSKNEENGQLPPSHLEKSVDSALVCERLRSMITTMRQAERSFILFVDHFHCLVGSYEDKYTIDAANLLVPVLARRQIELIGACSLKQYQQYIERDAAFQRRFQEILTPEARQELA
jgi:ATP-dependent Clp protease ATP-binding subunit ClpA